MKSYIAQHKQSFGVVAKDYKKYRREYTDELYDFLLGLVKKQKYSEAMLLDIGCGVGNSTEPVARKALEKNISIAVHGCDPDVRMLEEARKSAKKQKLPMVYTEGSAEKLPYPRKSFSIAISGAAFHWFATKKAMKEISRVLVSGGMYCVFWEQSKKSKNPPIGVEVYKEYGFQGIPKELRDLHTIKKLFTDAGFSRVGTKKIQYSHVDTIDQSLGLIRTNSGYAVLSEKDKKECMRKMKQAHVTALPHGTQEIHTEIFVCYGFTK